MRINREVLSKELTDEEFLKEFVKRFECDGAVLIYFDSSIEFGFGRWRNSSGRKWVNQLFKQVKQTTMLNFVTEKNSAQFIDR